MSARPMTEADRTLLRDWIDPGLTEEEARFIFERWSNLPGILSADQEIEPEVGWALDRIVERSRLTIERIAVR